MPLKLGADERGVPGRIEEAIRRAVQRHKTAARFDVVEQGLLLGGLDVVDIGVDDQGSEMLEVIAIEVAKPLGVSDVDAPSGEHRYELRGSVRGAVVPAIAKKQDIERQGRSASRLLIAAASDGLSCQEYEREGPDS